MVGVKGCFCAYLGDDKKVWESYDATALVEAGAKESDILIEQGLADRF